jgi:hypothetical protein
MEDQKLKLIAYRIHEGMGVQLRPAERTRQWMDDTNEHFANRCLPLVIANQHGWDVLCSHDLLATWNGATATNAITVSHMAGEGAPPASSHFGYGVLTFSMPWVFRTPPGWNLMVRGPTNRPKHGICPLDGIMEADWIESTFTMNWKFTKPGSVRFERGEPIAMLMPIPRGAVENFEPEIQDMSANPELKQNFDAWSKSRSTFIQDLKVANSDAQDQRWQRDYTKNANQTKLRVKPFERKS